MQSDLHTDQQLMTLALAEGAKGEGLTAPNPAVGAVLVRDGQVLGQGYHRGAGKPHAEIEALADCCARGHHTEGADIFITLEPCSTTGRTPPCTQALIDNQIRRVIWAADDPNPAHQGAAREILAAAGIQVTSGVLAPQAEHLHRGFFKVHRQGLPWVIVKTAMSLDGRITRPPGEGQWLTGEKARADVQTLRGQVDAILTSGATARQDNPRLNYRGPRSEKTQPMRLVVTHQPQAGLPPEAHLRQANENGPTRFLDGNLTQNLQLLAQEGVQTLLVEAGGQLVAQFLEEGLVDEWIAYLAPLVTGGNVPAVAGQGTKTLADRLQLHHLSYHQLGDDLKLHGLLTPSEIRTSYKVKNQVS